MLLKILVDGVEHVLALYPRPVVHHDRPGEFRRGLVRHGDDVHVREEGVRRGLCVVALLERYRAFRLAE